MGRHSCDKHGGCLAVKKLKMALSLVFTSIALSVVGQLLIKHGTNKTGQLHLGSNLFGTLGKIATNKFIVLSFMMYGLSAAVWLLVLKKLDLSLAYPLASSSYIFIAVFSKVFFKEKISKLRWLSMVIIILGIVLLANS